MDQEKENSYLDTIAHLKNQISQLNKDIHAAATCGIQLLADKDELTAKIEKLKSEYEVVKQEKHLFEAKFHNECEALKSLSTELEFHKEKFDSLSINHEVLKKDLLSSNRKYSSLSEQHEDLKNEFEDLQLENKAQMKTILLQEDQLKKFQNQIEVSLCEGNDEEFTKLQSDLNRCMTQNGDLQEELANLQYKFEQLQVNEKRNNRLIEHSKEKILEKDHEISAYSTELKKLQDEMCELRCEMEALQFEQVDVNRRGNSVFAELDDRRILVEKEYKKLKTRHQEFCATYEENKKELMRSRSQMAILLTMASKQADTDYICELENSLFSAKHKISLLTNQMIREKSQTKHTFQEGGCFEELMKQSQEQVITLEKEVRALLTKNLVDKDKLTDTQRLLYQSEKNLSLERGEKLKCMLKIKELEQQAGIEEAPTKNQFNVEVLPGFQVSDEQKQAIVEKHMKNIHTFYLNPINKKINNEKNKVLLSPTKSNKCIVQEHVGKENVQAPALDIKKVTNNQKKPMHVKDSNCAQQ